MDSRWSLADVPFTCTRSTDPWTIPLQHTRTPIGTTMSVQHYVFATSSVREAGRNDEHLDDLLSMHAQTTITGL